MRSRGKAKVQAVLCAVISYYRFPGSTPFEIARGSYGKSATQLGIPIRENTGGIDLATYGGARGVSIP